MPPKGWKKDKGEDGVEIEAAPVKSRDRGVFTVCGAFNIIQRTVDDMESPSQKADTSRAAALLANSLGLRESRSEGKTVWVDG